MLFDPEDPTSCTRGSRDSKPPAGQGLSFIAVESMSSLELEKQKSAGDRSAPA